MDGGGECRRIWSRKTKEFKDDENSAATGGCGKQKAGRDT